MNDKENILLNYKIGQGSVKENLLKAVECGALTKSQDGMYQLPISEPEISPWISITKAPSLDCQFKMLFLFDHVYARSIVPMGCKNCYKVCITLKNLSQLMALKSVQAEMSLTSKCGVEVDRQTTQNIYSGFFYCVGLDDARLVYKEARKMIDAHPKLGPVVSMRIKRGCTEYELHCGPSNQFKFAPELEELEFFLSHQFKRPVKGSVNALVAKLNTQLRWIHTAFRIGDDTYLEFTGGKRLYPETVTYDPLA